MSPSLMPQIMPARKAHFSRGAQSMDSTIRTSVSRCSRVNVSIPAPSWAFVARSTPLSRVQSRAERRAGSQPSFAVRSGNGRCSTPARRPQRQHRRTTLRPIMVPTKERLARGRKTKPPLLVAQLHAQRSIPELPASFARPPFRHSGSKVPLISSHLKVRLAAEFPNSVARGQKYTFGA